VPCKGECYFTSTRTANKAEVTLFSIPIFKPNSTPNTASPNMRHRDMMGHVKT